MAPDNDTMIRKELLHVLFGECARKVWRPGVTDPEEAPCFIPDALMVRVAGEISAGGYFVQEMLTGVAQTDLVIDASVC